MFLEIGLCWSWRAYWELRPRRQSADINDQSARQQQINGGPTFIPSQVRRSRQQAKRCKGRIIETREARFSGLYAAIREGRFDLGAQRPGRFVGVKPPRFDYAKVAHACVGAALVRHRKCSDPERRQDFRDCQVGTTDSRPGPLCVTVAVYGPQLAGHAFDVKSCSSLAAL